QRPCDADALPLAAGELVRVVLHLIRPQSDLFEQLGDPLALRAAGSDAVDAERLADNIAGSHPWIERGERVLEDDLHGAPDRTQLGLAEVGNVALVQPDAAAGRLDQAQDAACHGRFAAAGLADKAQCFADAKRETDTVDRMHDADLAAQDAAAHRIIRDEVRYFEQRAGLVHGGPASSAARQHAAR